MFHCMEKNIYFFIFTVKFIDEYINYIFLEKIKQELSLIISPKCNIV